MEDPFIHNEGDSDNFLWVNLQTSSHLVEGQCYDFFFSFITSFLISPHLLYSIIITGVAGCWLIYAYSLISIITTKDCVLLCLSDLGLNYDDLYNSEPLIIKNSKLVLLYQY